MDRKGEQKIKQKCKTLIKMHETKQHKFCAWLIHHWTKENKIMFLINFYSNLLFG